MRIADAGTCRVVQGPKDENIPPCPSNTTLFLPPNIHNPTTIFYAETATSQPIMANPKTFSLEGKGLKLTTAEDIEPHIQALKDNSNVEEVVFVGNTLGIGASEALAKVLETKKNLKVLRIPYSPFQSPTTIFGCLVGRGANTSSSFPLGRQLRRHFHLASTLRDPARAR